MARVFISYRREGGSGFSGRIADDLERRFGASEVSRDVEDIRSGEDFAERIDRALEQSSVLLAVVDKVWLSACDSRGRRLDDPKDFVRLEIVTALKKGVRVIPVLVGGAAMPLARELPDNLKLLPGGRHMNCPNRAGSTTWTRWPRR
ncbi:MAG: toll/interleukin-1 receptor domain-containing protein [Acidimicrobiia bacterium]|nr:toll/interleukin-1 receptor domain-containing protein [Acidimicrobiia bacterium]